ncbi:hypothetical protein EX011_21665 [Salmonella enterica]|nr:hypothetical protein [Salmonella enterica]EBL7042132.1 hypothetical protein [Salmonella enterica]EJF7575710.1 hypothetical protein [Salmonella enterica subsp. enterica]HAV7961511.1 hypothetical protein [Escherichia coli]
MTSSILQMALRASNRLVEESAPPVRSVSADNAPEVIEGVLFQHNGQTYHAFEDTFSVWVIPSINQINCRPYWRPICPERNHKLHGELNAILKEITDNGPENA